MELVKDYDIDIQYHPGNANVVADALSRKTAHSSTLITKEPRVHADFERAEIVVALEGLKAQLARLTVKSTLQQRLVEAQVREPGLVRVLNEMEIEPAGGYSNSSDGGLLYQGRLCVPMIEKLNNEILKEAHNSPFVMHPGGTKMSQDIRPHFWWCGMKKDIAKFVNRCLVIQQVKTPRQRPAGLLQPLNILEWKWENIAMDFIVDLPKTLKGYSLIWVIMDRLTKSAHFLPGKATYTVDNWAHMYMKEIVRLHGVPMWIVSDRDPRFTLVFCRGLQKALGTRLDFSTAFHPQTDGQTERLNQILEDMLRACVLDFTGSWDLKLHLMEFAYNNKYPATIDMALFEALYEKRCRTPLFWNEVGKWELVGLELVQVMNEAMQQIRGECAPLKVDRRVMRTRDEET